MQKIMKNTETSRPPRIRQQQVDLSFAQIVARWNERRLPSRYIDLDVAEATCAATRVINTDQLVSFVSEHAPTRHVDTDIVEATRARSRVI